MKIFFALAIMLTMAARTSAATLNANFFTVEVPAGGWTLQAEGENSAMLVSPDKSIVFTVTKMTAESTPLKETAARMAKTHGSQDLVRMEGQGEAWEYTGTANGQSLYAQVFDFGNGVYGGITITGSHESDIATDVFNSIKFKK